MHTVSGGNSTRVWGYSSIAMEKCWKMWVDSVSSWPHIVIELSSSSIFHPLTDEKRNNCHPGNHTPVAYQASDKKPAIMVGTEFWKWHVSRLWPSLRNGTVERCRRLNGDWFQVFISKTTKSIRSSWWTPEWKLPEKNQYSSDWWIDGDAWSRSMDFLNGKKTVKERSNPITFIAKTVNLFY